MWGWGTPRPLPTPCLSSPPPYQDDFDDEVFLVGTLQAVVFCKAKGFAVRGSPAAAPPSQPFPPPPQPHAPISFSQ